MSASVYARGLRVVYPGGHVALDGVDLEAGEGVFGLLGPNGAGKTTLLRVLATLLLPSAGEVGLAGLPLPAEAAQARFHLGYLPQEFGLFPRLRTRECLDYLALLKGLEAPDSRRAETAACLRAVHLHDMAERKVGALSGGMRRRLGIAGALLGSPEVLILDEPTAGLDPEERTRLWNLLGGLAHRRTVLLSTHNVADVAALCTRLAVLEGGRVRFTGTPAVLAGLAQGRVWELRLSPEELDSRSGSWRVVGTHPQGDKVLLRILSDLPPDPLAHAVEPSVEDGYLWVVGEPADHAAVTSVG